MTFDEREADHARRRDLSAVRGGRPPSLVATGAGPPFSHGPPCGSGLLSRSLREAWHSVLVGIVMYAAAYHGIHFDPHEYFGGEGKAAAPRGEPA